MLESCTGWEYLCQNYFSEIQAFKIFELEEKKSIKKLSSLKSLKILKQTSNF